MVAAELKSLRRNVCKPILNDSLYPYTNTKLRTYKCSGINYKNHQPEMRHTHTHLHIHTITLSLISRKHTHTQYLQTIFYCLIENGF